MTLIREVLHRDPTSWDIPNLGVAKVGRPQSEQEWQVLRYELESFVADGEYGDGLRRIMDSFLKSLDEPSQPAAWVSGFYGSGKSHLVRMLDALWVDRTLPDGATARGLVSLPSEVSDLFAEFDTRQKQFGGTFAAAGHLSPGGTSIALEILSVVFSAAELPVDYAAARFTLWLKGEGLLESVTAHLASDGRSLEDELANLYVSGPLADAVIAARPGIAESTAAMHQLLRAQFPSPKSINDDDFLEAFELALHSTNERKDVPLTLIVLDELQQFIGDDTNRALEVQHLVEAACSKFESRVLFAGTGQMALGATPVLQKLQDRFRITVSLQDRDVDRVVRSVVLQKRPDKQAEIAQVLASVSGEIDRQLSGTAIAPTGADKKDLVPDYPLLPSRRRLWERLLRTLDTSGRAGQLRTQLRIVLDATKGVAEREVGVVVAADQVYDDLESALQQSGSLPPSTAQMIAGLDDGTEEGKLRSRVAKVVYLVGKLPQDGPMATGVKATGDVIADLLVEDLRHDGATLRANVPTAIEALLKKGTLSKIQDGTYSLQTEVSEEWAKEYQGHLGSLMTDAAWQTGKRDELLREAMGSVQRGIRVRQGKSLVSRKVEYAWGPNEPTADEGAIPVWIRDGWSATERSVKSDAQSAGTDSPLVLVWIPKERVAELKDAMSEAEAAARTVDLRAIPTTADGKDARAGFISQRDTARGRERELVDSVVQSARVYQAGGNEVTDVAGSSVDGALTQAVENAVLRLFPDFDAADGTHWDAVLKRAREGAADPLKPLGHQGATGDHVVAKAIKAYLGPNGRLGRDARKQFQAPPHGWPQDAIDGSLLALVAAQEVRARYNGQPTSAAELKQNIIGAADFRPESVVVPAKLRIAVREIAAKVGLASQDYPDADLPRVILKRMRALAEEAGGPAPLPPAPDIEMLRELEGEDGNAQVVAVAQAHDALVQIAADWTSLSGRIPARQHQWDDAHRLLRHAEGLSIHAQAGVQLEAIKESRSLLDDPDPVDPVIEQLGAALRSELKTKSAAFSDAMEAGLQVLEQAPPWQAVATVDRPELLRKAGLTDHASADVGTTSELLAALDSVPLADWGFKIDAIDAQVKRAHEEAVRLTTPEPVRVKAPPGVIKNDTELQAYLDQLGELIKAHLDDDDTVVI